MALCCHRASKHRDWDQRCPAIAGEKTWGLCMDRMRGKSSLKQHGLCFRGTGQKVLLPVLRVIVIPIR